MKIMIINGANLNMLGIRQPDVYGKLSYNELVDKVKKYANSKSVTPEFFQSNIEGEIINAIHNAHFEKFDGIIINPGAYTHYSYAIYDAIKGVNVPCVEVHLSNIHNRDEFRKNSVIAPSCIGQISGFGAYGYFIAIDALVNHIKNGGK